MPSPGDLVTGQSFDGPAWDQADLSETVFDDCTFTDGLFGGATMNAARFVNCRLVRCVFTHTDLREASFKRCVLRDPGGRSGANFAFARLDEASFDHCDLTHARFEGADLYAAAFRDCQMLGVQFARARFHRAFGRSVVRASVSLLRCNLELCDLSGARLGG